MHDSGWYFDEDNKDLVFLEGIWIWMAGFNCHPIARKDIRFPIGVIVPGCLNGDKEGFLVRADLRMESYKFCE